MINFTGIYILRGTTYNKVVELNGIIHLDEQLTLRNSYIFQLGLKFIYSISPFFVILSHSWRVFSQTPSNNVICNSNVNTFWSNEMKTQIYKIIYFCFGRFIIRKLGFLSSITNVD